LALLRKVTLAIVSLETFGKFNQVTVLVHGLMRGNNA
jgi:hypothetical protein